MFDALAPWNERGEDGIRFYSGSATYSRRVPDPRVAGGGRVVLDLGDVRNVAVVSVNGREFPVLWRPPFRVDVTDALGAAGEPVDISVRVTNLWPNRLIGDDSLPCDAEYGGGARGGGGIAAIPKRVFDGAPSPCGRHTFTTWRLWKSTDALLPSGLLGPVRLLSAQR